MGSFTKNVIKLTSGDFSAQIISLVAVPLITRIYSPDDYGLFAIFTSIIMILAPVSSLRFNYALMLPGEHDDAINLLGLSLLSVFVFSCLVAAVTAILHLYSFLPQKWISTGFKNYLLVVPLGILILGSSQTLMSWALRNKMFGSMSLAHIFQSIADRGFAITIGWFTITGAFGLIFGRILGSFVALSYLIKRALSHEIKHLWARLSFQEMKRLAHRYREYHLLASVSLLFSKISREIPIFLLALLFSPIITGYYALSMRVVNLPIMMIGDAISKVFFQKATELKQNKGNLAEVTVKLISSLVYLSLPPVLVFFFFGNVIFSFVFGSVWSDAGAYTQILIFSFFGMFLNKPLSVLFDTFERQRQKLFFDFCLLIARIGAIIIGGFIFNSIQITLWFLAISTFIIYFFSFIYLFGLVGVNINELFLIILYNLMKMLPIIVGIPASYLFLAKSNIIICIILSTSILLQATVILIYYPELKKRTIKLLPIFKIQ